jgi:Putative peptidoglycan binding domain
MKHLLFFLLLLCANTTFAQSKIPEFPFDTTGLPKTFIQKPEPGACYAFVYQPDIYATPDGKRYEVFMKRKKYIEPTYNYTTINEWHHFPPRLERKPNVEIPENMQLLDPVYKEITMQKEVVPASTKWVVKQGDRNCLSVKPFFAQVFCLVEVPAQYQPIIEKIEEVQPARKVVGKDTIALDSATLFNYYWEVKEKKRLIYKECTGTTKGRVFYTDTFYCSEPLPKDAVLVEKNGISGWKKVVCDSHGEYYPTILKIKTVLKNKGYDVGDINGILDPKSKKAIVQFQKDNNLPIGALDLKTLKALGVERN